MTDAKNADELRYRQILDLAPAVIYLKDSTGRYIFVNRHFELLSGFSADPVLGRTDFDLFPEQVAQYSIANDRRVLAEGKPLEIEEIGPVDGVMHTFHSAKFPIFDGEDRISAICGISTDITARKAAERRLRESEERFRVALEANPDPVVMCDMQQCVDYFNPAFSHVFGWQLEPCKGRSLASFIAEPDRVALAGLMRILLAERHLPATEIRHLTCDHRYSEAVYHAGAVG